MFLFPAVRAPVLSGRGTLAREGPKARERQSLRAKWPGRRKRRDFGVTVEAITRRGTAEFEPSFAALKTAIDRACARETRWETRVVAGIGAAIEFTLEDVAAARALTVCAGALTMDDRDLEGEMLANFAEVLEDVAPDQMLFPISSAMGIVETIAALIRGHLLAGRIEEIGELGPELVYLALMPYVGLGDARKWAATFSLSGASTVD
jgi:hypothetical protein